MAFSQVTPSQPALPPGPRMPGFAQAVRWTLRPIQMMDECNRRYGDAFTLRIGDFPPVVVTSDPAIVREVFASDSEGLLAGRSNAVLKPLLGAQSLLLLDGKRHRDDRKLMMPSFHGERMQAYAKVMRELSDQMIDRWPLGKQFALHSETQEVTLEVILATVFGLAGAGSRSALRSGLKKMLAYGEHPTLLLMIGQGGEVRWRRLHEWLGRLSPWSRFQRTIGEVNAALLDEIRARRGAEAGTDVLSMLLAAKDEHGRHLDDEALVDEMKTLLVAGHETSATALTWTMYRLLRHPDVLARLRRELEHGDEYLEAVIKETMRLHPILPMVGRMLEHPRRFGRLDLPAGVVIAPCIYLTQRRPDVWADPERFDPDRFAGKKTSPYEWFPFGGGVRRCLGMAFAMYEMRIVLRQIVMRTELQIADGYRARMTRRGVTFAMAGGLPVVRIR